MNLPNSLTRTVSTFKKKNCHANQKKISENFPLYGSKQAATVPKYDDLDHAKPVAVDATNGLKSCLFMVKCRLIILSFMAWTTEKFQFCCWLFKETPVLSSPHSKDRAN